MHQNQNIYYQISMPKLINQLHIYLDEHGYITVMVISYPEIAKNDLA